ncbi:MAG: Flp pilus assembly protein CpaB [Bryobacteraceae bacterium]
MKRNMVPLLGIAFVVAIISTGVFYGLFAGKLRSSSELPGHAIVVAARDLDRGTVIQPSDLRVSEVQGVLEGAFSKPEDAAGATLLTALKTDEPLLQERVAPRVSEAPGGRVPAGMRALSLHVFQSESVLSLLRPGSRVDVQAVSERNGSTELRTVLENVQILAVSAADANGNRPAGAAVTVLIRAEDSDMIALADSGSRIRVALRNPLDPGTTPRHALTLAGLFAGGTQKADGLESPGHPNRAVWDHPIQMYVHVLAVSDGALADLQAQTVTHASGDALKLSAFRSSDDARKLIESLQQKHELEMVSSERLMAGLGRPISYHAGPKPYALRVQFSPEWMPSGKLGLRVKPRLGFPNGSEFTTKKYDAALADTSSFLVEGFPNDAPGQDFAERLFPGRSWKNKHLVIFVSTLIIQQTSPLAVARNGRRR